MNSDATTPEEYLADLPADKQLAVKKLREAVLKNLPEGFVEVINYGMLGYVVPLTLFPAGYHCNPSMPLPFANIAAQKNFIALYHMGIYANAQLLNWFKEEYAKQVTYKLDMGKSCIRFKNATQIPYELIGELMQKLSVSDWVALYESNLKKPKTEM